MKRIMTSFICLVLTLGMGFLSGCSAKPAENTSAGEEKKLSVFASFYTMYDFTKKIGGDRINVTNIIPSGVEAHHWEPSPSDIASLKNADMFVYNGVGMEGWVDKVLESLKSDKLVAVDTSKSATLLEKSSSGKEHEHEHEGEHEEEEHEAGHEEGHNHGDLKYDPHIWLDPMNAKKQMEAIKDALVKVDPSNKDYYEQNYQDNAKKLDELDKAFKDAASGFKTKDIVVSHKAFGYLCNAYGLNQVAIEGLNAESEPTAAKMAEIVDFVKKNNVKYIFTEELLSPKTAEAIAKESGAQVAVLSPVEGLEEKDIQAGQEYLSVMRRNLEVLKKALE
ncbi:zinc transport system substrate-binding protein [Anaerobacterium chartisolvens]|uniref:Zinc transport system substrate-binding protein n=1 Tax=Anaerobacterium chartisolvens TaxID=1297424 RepID=A0A369BGS7_9FIRM|nr:metal ABC transporter substrate-binding protein [Anaerobacterium chartisolvens]RCX18884.1 zinc transport system substrate-binding protein [Anaerobacterium chartisolvens]